MSCSTVPFYVTLPSDSSMQLFKNTAADWTTKLHTPLTLSGKWEVGLVELHYPNTLYNIPEPQTFTCTQYTDLTPGRPPLGMQHVITIPAGIYTRISVIEKIRDFAPKLTPLQNHLKKTPLNDRRAFSIILGTVDKKCKFTLNSPRVSIEFTEDSRLLQTILGFQQSKLTFHAHPNFETLMRNAIADDETPSQNPPPLIQGSSTSALLEYLFERTSKVPVNVTTYDIPLEYTSENSVYADAGSQNLFVYCDVADFSYVGDTTAQLLRAVPIKGQRFDMITERFDEPHYVPVIRNHVESIKVNLSTEHGNSKFQAGKSLVKLHFRPMKYR